jgi:hypothetical protein
MKICNAIKPSGRLIINPVIYILFATPIICILIVVFTQFNDELFKKKFVIDRRNHSAGQGYVRRSSSDPLNTPTRRYRDVKAPETSAAPSADAVSPAPERAAAPSWNAHRPA